MANDPLLPPDDSPSDLPGPPSPSSGRQQRSITCEFCQCRLTPAGDYLTLSDEAKAYRAQGERIDRLNADLATARQELADARRDLEEVRGQLRQATAKKNFWNREVNS